MNHTSLHYAILEDDLRGFERLLRDDPARIDVLDRGGLAPHDIAVREDEPRYLKRLIAAGLHARPALLHQLALDAVSCHAWRAFAVLLPLVDDVNRRSDLNDTLWMRVARAGEEDEREAERALKRLAAMGAEVNALDDEADTVLMFNACWGRTRRVKALLSLGVDPNLRDATGDAALAWAAQSGVWPCVDALLRAGATPQYAPRGFLGPPLHKAAYVGSARSVRLLLRAGADPDELDAQGRTFIEAAQAGLERLDALRAGKRDLTVKWIAGERYMEVMLSASGYACYVDHHAAILRMHKTR